MNANTGESILWSRPHNICFVMSRSLVVKTNFCTVIVGNPDRFVINENTRKYTNITTK